MSALAKLLEEGLHDCPPYATAICVTCVDTLGCASEEMHRVTNPEHDIRKIPEENLPSGADFIGLAVNHFAACVELLERVAISTHLVAHACIPFESGCIFCDARELSALIEKEASA